MVLYLPIDINALVFFRIKAPVFIKLAEEICELFPTKEQASSFIPYTLGANQQGIGPRGLLYSAYKTIRKELRLAKKLPEKVRVDKDKANESTVEGMHFNITLCKTSCKDLK